MSAVAELTWGQEPGTQDFPPVFQNSPVGFACFDLKGRPVASNPAFDKMTAISATNSSSRNLSDLILSPKLSAARDLLIDLMAQRRDSFEVDSCPDAAGTMLRWAVWRLFGNDGAPDRIVVLITPIVPMDVQSQRQVGRLETIGRMAAGVAHDFNNVMTGVMLYCDLLLASLEPAHRARKHAEEIRQAGLQATGLIRQLLKLSKPDAGQSRLVSLNQIVESMKGLLTRLTGARIDLQIHLDPVLGFIKIDPTQAQQIVLNLVLNARDAMPDGGCIKLVTQACKIQPLNGARENASAHGTLPCVAFEVEDNGEGMDAATCARAFDPFFTTKGSAGTGLGLATVHQIVTSRGGLIHIDSEPGRGTRVTILLPAQQLYPEPGMTKNSDSQHVLQNRKAPSFTTNED